MATRQFDFIVGPETSTLPSIGTPTGDDDLITLGYADDRYTQGGEAVADVAALKAIAAVDRRDGDLFLLKSTNDLYRFDSASAATGDDNFVITPTSGTGRWIRSTILNRANTFTDTTQSTNKDTGGAIFEGGVGIEKNLNVGGNAIITGNLTVSGTTTTINSTTLDVTDANITVNKGGTTLTANTSVAGITVETSGTSGRLGYDSTLASRYKAGDLGSESEIITAANTQTLSGAKTFSAAINVSSTTQATNKDTGSIITEGGVGIEKDLYVGGAAVITGDISINGASVQTQLNAKQPTGNYITSLTGGVTASGPGSAAATVVTNANLTGPITSTGNATSVTAQTGTGTTFVMQASPTLTTPVLGVATATSVNKVALTAPATSATLTIADGKTATVSNTLTLTGTDGSTVAAGAGGTVQYLGTVQTVTGAKTFAQDKLLLQDNSTNTVTLSTTNATTSYTVKLPATQGAASTTLNNDGAGNLTWAASASTVLSQFSTDVGDSTNTRTPVNTNLLGSLKAQASSTTVTITIANPAVVTWAVHGAVTGDKVYFTNSGGALPTGVTASTSYFIIRIDANSFNIATTLANAHAGTTITTTGSQSGTHTGFLGGLMFANLDATIRGTVSGNNTTAGYVGEVLATAVTSAISSGITATQYGNVASLTLTKGHWIVYSGIQNTRASGQNEITAAISIFSGNTTTDHANGVNVLTSTALTTGAGNTLITLPPWQQSVSASTTQFLKAKIDPTGTWTAANFTGYMTAVRIS